MSDNPCNDDYVAKTIKLNDGSNITLCVKNCDTDYRSSDNENIENKQFSLDNLITSTKPFKYVCIREKKDNSNCRPDEKENKLGQCIKFADQYIPPDDMNIINTKSSVPQIPIIDVVNDIQKRLICTKRTISENECSILGGNWNQDSSQCTNRLSSFKDEELDSEECGNVRGLQEDGQCIIPDDYATCTNNDYLYLPDTKKCVKRIYNNICHGMSN